MLGTLHTTMHKHKKMISKIFFSETNQQLPRHKEAWWRADLPDRWRI